MKYQIYETDGYGSVIAYGSAGEVFSADQDHPRFAEIVTRLRANDETALELFDLSAGIKKNIDKYLTHRIKIEKGIVYFDNKPVNNALTDLICRFVEENQDFTPLVSFFERVNNNPNLHSRDQLFRWLQTHKFAITPSGYIVGYKGVQSDFGSSHSGPGIVNGVPKNGHLDNTPGNVLEIDRALVVFDPQVGCAAGLHVGTWDYAKSFAAVTVEVHVDPADVVSVPTDCSDAKMRVAKYKVIRQIDKSYETSLVL